MEHYWIMNELFIVFQCYDGDIVKKKSKDDPIFPKLT